jgi:predicted Zn-ribbon and HTH transcriptional regulator
LTRYLASGLRGTMMETQESTFLYDAFLSYRHVEPDRSFTRDLLQRLENAGLKVAIDVRDFRPQEAFPEEMERCIRQSRYTLAVISPRYLTSGNTREEAILCRTMDMAERRRRLIPLILEPVELPYWLYEPVGISFAEKQPLVDPIQRLVKTLSAHLELAKITEAEPVSSSAPEKGDRFPASAPIVCDHCGYEFGEPTGTRAVISRPDDCRCPKCGSMQDWLRDYAERIRFCEERGIYLINAFSGSPLRRPPLARYIEYENDGIVLRSGKFPLRVMGLVLTEEALKCPRLLFFRDGENIRKPDLPVRGEYYGLVKLARNPVHEPITGDYIVPVEIAMWQEPVLLRYTPKEIQEEEALLLSWPNFNLPGWNVYFYLLEAAPTLMKAGLALRALFSHKAPRILYGSRGQLTEPCEAFEIVSANGERISAQAGIFKTARVPIQKGDAPLTIALDFDTSGSSVWFKLAESDSKLLRFRDFTETLIPNRVLSDVCLKRSYWLPTYRLNDTRTAEQFYRAQFDTEYPRPPEPESIIEKFDYFIPASLLVTPPVSAEQLLRPLDGFRILHPYADHSYGEVNYPLKRMDSGDHANAFYEWGVSAYLEFFLSLALASIINSEASTGHLKVRASFPLSFSTAELHRYIACLDGALKTIKRLTGFTIDSQRYIDEASAAALSTPLQEGFTLVMNMGSDTTDLAIFSSTESQLEPIFSESLHYGSDAFLQLLSSPNEADLFPRPTESFESRLLWLLRETRLRDFDTVARTNYRGNKHSREAMLDLLTEFYAPVIFFVRRFFEAIPIHRGDDKDYRKELATCHLVGSGWLLGDAMTSSPERFPKGHPGFVRYLLAREGFTDVTRERASHFRTLAAAPRAAIGYGTINAEEKFLCKNIEELSDYNRAQSIAGLSFYFTDGSDYLEQIEWHQSVPRRLDRHYLRPVLSGIEIPPEWKFIKFSHGEEVQALEKICTADIEGVVRPVLTRSVLARFLERVYLPQLHRVRRI